MGPFGGDLLGTIPGAGVTEGGVAYYIEVENSDITMAQPSSAPDSVLELAVRSPEGVASAAARNIDYGSGYLLSAGIAVVVDVPLGAQFEQGTLYCRETGEHHLHRVQSIFSCTQLIWCNCCNN